MQVIAAQIHRSKELQWPDFALARVVKFAPARVFMTQAEALDSAFRTQGGRRPRWSLSQNLVWPRFSTGAGHRLRTCATGLGIGA